MIFQIFILVFCLYIFIYTAYFIEPGKNSENNPETDLDNYTNATYITDVTDTGSD